MTGLSSADLSNMEKDVFAAIGLGTVLRELCELGSENVGLRPEVALGAARVAEEIVGYAKNPWGARARLRG